MSGFCCNLHSKRFIDLTEDDVETLVRLADKFEDGGHKVVAEKLDNVIDDLNSEREYHETINRF